jgi:hypothetical protein
VVVGNSVGGSCALEVARAAPDQVEAVVLVGAKAGVRPDPALRAEAVGTLADGGIVTGAPDRQFHLVPNCGHYVNLERPTEFRTLLANVGRWLSEWRAGHGDRPGATPRTGDPWLASSPLSDQRGRSHGARTFRCWWTAATRRAATRRGPAATARSTATATAAVLVAAATPTRTASGTAARATLRPTAGTGLRSTTGTPRSRQPHRARGRDRGAGRRARRRGRGPGHG